MSDVAPASAAAPIIVTALFGAGDAAWFDELRVRHFPPERNQLKAHLTMFHHLAPSLERELKQRLAAETSRVRAPEARIAGLMSLGRGVAFRIESPALEDVRDRLADAFAAVLTPQDRAGWRPHVTVQNKVEPAVAKALQAELARDFQARTVRLAGLASWWYRGGPWEPLSRHMFA
ncbi:2'-5' RNA ligase family protein [Sphingomonas glacialis]|uniref:2'-5' RNA ligase family protein n=1 Tax=Sphingomonas glacialis TaxID=658225 RepID=A0A502FIX9_9SPHN|nr:2'-5' RNA ligase family protein [Sphingomonas glacialis]TPG49073.1 2'-5' RNA ligase family protein [Sphingomonas glacialis]